MGSLMSPLSSAFLDLFENSSFSKRLKFLVSQGKDPVVNFLTIDMVFQGYYAQQLSLKGEEFIRPYIEADVEHVDDGAGTSDEKLLKALHGWIERGQWYDDKIIPDRHPSEKILMWVRKWLLDSPDVLFKSMSTILDWVDATRTPLEGLSPAQAVHRARRWHAALRRKKKEDEDLQKVSTLEKVAELEDGVAIFRLKADDLSAEGSAMDHCIGRSPRFASAIRNKTGEAFSVRRNLKRAFTVFVEAKSIEQFKGRKNRLPRPDDQKIDFEAALLALEWFKKSGYRITCYDTKEAVAVLNNRRDAVAA